MLDRVIIFLFRYKDCKVDRGRLTVINASFLVILAAFTMMICLLLSAAFDDDQCVLWVQKVMQSIAMQVLVTGPLIGLVVLCVKIFVSWLLLRSNAHTRSARRLAELEEQVQQTKHRRFEIAAQLRRLAADADGDARGTPTAGQQQQEARLRRWGLMRSLQRITATEVVLEARKKKAALAADAHKSHGLLARQNSLRRLDSESSKKSNATLDDVTVVTAWAKATRAGSSEQTTTRTIDAPLKRIVPQMRMRSLKTVASSASAAASGNSGVHDDDEKPRAGFSVRSRIQRRLRAVPQFVNRSTSSSRKRTSIRSRRKRSHAKAGEDDSEDVPTSMAKSLNPRPSSGKIEVGTRDSQSGFDTHATVIEVTEVEL